MKLILNKNQEVILDFNYQDSFRDLRKGEKAEHFGNRKSKKSVVITTCTILDTVGFENSVTIKCDAKNHNRYFARKYSLEKLLNQYYHKDFRTKVWKAYWDYTKSDKLQFLNFGDLGFINSNGKITIEYLGYSDTITEEQRSLLIKLLK